MYRSYPSTEIMPSSYNLDGVRSNMHSWKDCCSSKRDIIQLQHDITH